MNTYSLYYILETDRSKAVEFYKDYMTKATADNIHEISIVMRYLDTDIYLETNGTGRLTHIIGYTYHKAQIHNMDTNVLNTIVYLLLLRGNSIAINMYKDSTECTVLECVNKFNSRGIFRGLSTQSFKIDSLLSSLSDRDRHRLKIMADVLTTVDTGLSELVVEVFSKRNYERVVTNIHETAKYVNRDLFIKLLTTIEFPNEDDIYGLVTKLESETNEVVYKVILSMITDSVGYGYTLTDTQVSRLKKLRYTEEVLKLNSSPLYNRMCKLSYQPDYLSFLAVTLGYYSVKDLCECLPKSDKNTLKSNLIRIRKSELESTLHTPCLQVANIPENITTYPSIYYTCYMDGDKLECISSKDYEHNIREGNIPKSVVDIINDKLNIMNKHGISTNPTTFENLLNETHKV